MPIQKAVLSPAALQNATFTGLLRNWSPARVEQLHAQIAELKQEQKSSHQRVQLLGAARDSVVARVQEVKELVRSERESLREHFRSAKDPALRGVDQARQEVSLLQAQVAATANRHAGIEADPWHGSASAESANSNIN